MKKLLEASAWEEWSNMEEEFHHFFTTEKQKTPESLYNKLYESFILLP